MQIEIKIDSTCTEPKIVIWTHRMTPEVQELVKKLSAQFPQMLTGFRGEVAEILEQDQIFRLYTAASRVYADTENGEYLLRQRLYELEERLDSASFTRISNSEIINLKRVKSFDLSFSGTICVALSNGVVTYVSRRYVSKIKQVLGL